MLAWTSSTTGVLWTTLTFVCIQLANRFVPGCLVDVLRGCCVRDATTVDAKHSDSLSPRDRGDDALFLCAGFSLVLLDHFVGIAEGVLFVTILQFILVGFL